MTPVPGILEYYKQEAEKIKAEKPSEFDSPLSNQGASLSKWDRTRFQFGDM
jgi:hypothetical protein